MVAPTFVAAGTAAGGTQSVSPGLPSGHQEDDILLLEIENHPSNAKPAAPTGYTEVATGATDTGALNANTQGTLFWKRDTGSESAPTVADSGNHTLAQITAWRGCITTGDPWAGTPVATVNDVLGTALSADGYTTGVDETMVVVHSAVGDNLANQFSSWANSNLVSITEAYDSNTSAGKDGSIGCAYGVLTSAGAIGTTTATITQTEKQVNIVIALRPPAAGGSSIVKVVNEILQISDGQLRALGLARVLNETEQVGDAQVTALGLVRVLNESSNISETLSTVIGLVRVLDETADISESEDHLVGVVRILSEASNIAETLGVVVGLIRVLDETADIAEAENHLQTIVRILNETVQTTDTIVRALGIVRLLNESEEISEVIVRAIGLLRVVDETANISETNVHQGGLTRVVNESMDITEAIVDIVAAALGDILTLTFDGVFNLTKSFSGAFNLTKAFAGAFNLRKTFKGKWNR